MHRIGTPCLPISAAPTLVPGQCRLPELGLLPVLTPALCYKLSISSYLPWLCRSGNPSTTLSCEHPPLNPTCTHPPQRFGSHNSIFVGYPLHLPQPIQRALEDSASANTLTSFPASPILLPPSRCDSAQARLREGIQAPGCATLSLELTLDKEATCFLRVPLTSKWKKKKKISPLYHYLRIAGPDLL